MYCDGLSPGRGIRVRISTVRYYTIGSCYTAAFSGGLFHAAYDF